MVSDEIGMQLHDRETIGEPLTAQEKAQLEAWYTQKDVAEAAMLEADQVPLPNLVVLQDSGRYRYLATHRWRSATPADYPRK
jgi:hypothetical protein